jgi:LysR family transcriptional regulator, regulator of gene expression of beta-lactamase
MDRSQIPLNALRAFEVAARHLNFTRAAIELRVSQTALSHQIKALETRLGFALFRRLPRGVALTDEGLALVPSIRDAFDRMGATLDRFVGGRYQEVVMLGVVSTFANGWLLPRLEQFAQRHPAVDLRIMTNNNRVDLAGEGLDFAVRFGDGSWHGVEAMPLLEAPLCLMGAPAVVAGLASPRDVTSCTLLRSYRSDEWPRWFACAGLPAPKLHGPVFDSSIAIAQAATAGAGLGLLPKTMFAQELATERLIAPFDLEIDAGRYWLTRLNTRAETLGMAAFRKWIVSEGARFPGSAPATPQAI